MCKRILITGGTGYLGSNILAALIKLGHEVVLLKRRNSSIDRIQNHVASIKMIDIEGVTLLEVLLQNNIDTIIHLATSYGRNGESHFEIRKTNVEFPTNLLDAAIKAKVRFFINTDTALPAEVNSYAFTKKQFCTYLQSKKDRINVINIVPEYFYGPDDDSWKLITMIMRKLVQQSPVIEFTDGLQQRDFIYITDVVNAYITILSNMEQLKGWKEFSVSSGQTISIREMAELCKDLCNNETTELAFGVIPNRQNDLLLSSTNNLALKQLGWNLQFNLSDGITLMKNALNNN